MTVHKWLVGEEITADRLNSHDIKLGDIIFRTMFESLDGYQTTVNCNISFERLELFTDGTLNNQAWVRKMPDNFPLASWDKDRELHLMVKTVYLTLQEIWLIMGQGTPTLTTKRHIGWKIVNDTLYGTVADGTTEATLNCGTITADYYNLKIKYEAGVEAEFFVDGVSKGTISSNLPSGTTYANRVVSIQMIAKDANTKDIFLTYWAFWQRGD